MHSLLRPNQIEELKDDKARVEAAKKSPDSRVDKREAHRQGLHIDTMLETQAPRYPKGAEKDRIVAEEKQLREEITQGMPDETTMRKNPPGAVDRHMAWEKRNKEKIIRWKNTRQLLNEEGDINASNLERYRPKGTQDMMANAQIPGHFAPGQNVPQENWDLIFGDPEAKQAAIRAVAQQFGMPAEVVEEKLGTLKRQRESMANVRKQKGKGAS